MKAAAFIALILAALPSSVTYQSGFVSRELRAYGASALISTAQADPDEGSAFYAWVGVRCKDALLVVGYAVLPASYWDVNGSIKHLNPSTPVGFYGAAFSNGSFSLFLVPCYPRIGSSHLYSLELAGSKWTAYYDNHAMGSLWLNAIGSYVVAGIWAPAQNETRLATPVYFDNVSWFDGRLWAAVDSGYRWVGSFPRRAEPVPYGSADDDANASFEVGPGLPAFNGTQLWPLYPVSVLSYGNVSRSLRVNGSIISLKGANVTAKGIIYDFQGWKGNAFGYTGNEANPDLQVLGQVEEAAVYSVLYQVNLSMSGEAPSTVVLSSSTQKYDISPTSNLLSVYLDRGTWSIAASRDNVTMASNVSTFRVGGPMNLGVKFSLDYLNLTVVDPLDLPIPGAAVNEGNERLETNCGGNVTIPVNPGLGYVIVNYAGARAARPYASPARLRVVLFSVEFIVRRSVLWVRLALSIAMRLL
ncbi:hypothetical protein PQ610_06030 [Tardisphaera miroshnichenkoae]